MPEGGLIVRLLESIDHGPALHEIRIVHRLLEIANYGESRDGRSIARLV